MTLWFIPSNDSPGAEEPYYPGAMALYDPSSVLPDTYEAEGAPGRGQNKTRRCNSRAGGDHEPNRAIAPHPIFHMEFATRVHLSHYWLGRSVSIDWGGQPPHVPPRPPSRPLFES